jgi:hypothetical protein
MSKRALTSIGCCWLVVLGCNASEPPAAAPPPAPPPKPSVVEGVVRLAEGAELPRYTPEQMERKVLEHVQRAALPPACTPPQNDDALPVRSNEAGLLEGVMVAVSGFKGFVSRAPRIHEVTIKDCRLAPRLVVAMRGDVLRIRNEVDYAFMPTFGPTSIVETLTRGQTKDVKLEQNGVQSVLCGFTAPCGRSDVVTLFHSLFAVTDAQGHFQISDFPEDQDVELHAWHPLFADSKLQVRITKGETRKVELVLTPTPAAPPAAAPADAGVAKAAAPAAAAPAPTAPAPAAPAPAAPAPAAPAAH